jgi:hypothetical protein
MDMQGDVYDGANNKQVANKVWETKQWGRAAQFTWLITTGRGLVISPGKSQVG